MLDATQEAKGTEAAQTSAELSLLSPLFPRAAKLDDVLHYGQAGDFPFAADQNADAKLAVAEQTIHHGGKLASRLILPVIADAKK